MKQPLGKLGTKAWARLGVRFMPFADVATPDLPLSRLWRLSLFQVSVVLSHELDRSSRSPWLTVQAVPEYDPRTAMDPAEVPNGT